MRLPAVIAGDGMAKFGQVEVEATKLEGRGQREVRQPGVWTDWHIPDKGAAVITVIQGKWEVETGDGSRRTFGPGAEVVMQDLGIPKDKGHRTGAVGTEPLILYKVFLDEPFVPIE